MLKYGLTTAQIVQALSHNNANDVLTTVEHEGEEINVVVQREAAETPKSVDDILATEIDTAIGMKMPLSKLVKV